MMKYLLPSDYQNDRYWTRMDLVIFAMLSFFQSMYPVAVSIFLVQRN